MSIEQGPIPSSDNNNPFQRMSNMVERYDTEEFRRFFEEIGDAARVELIFRYGEKYGLTKNEGGKTHYDGLVGQEDMYKLKLLAQDAIKEGNEKGVYYPKKSELEAKIEELYTKISRGLPAEELEVLIKGE